ncbi:MAG: phosphate ABC transporter ATP-binding protein, partial [Alphaproteobacteria bacterium]|nr:phosphate ABC transporter ATP-binding protein [Alphaproteobacteria bacterium]
MNAAVHAPKEPPTKVTVRSLDFYYCADRSLKNISLPL